MRFWQLTVAAGTTGTKIEKAGTIVAIALAFTAGGFRSSSPRLGRDCRTGHFDGINGRYGACSQAGDARTAARSFGLSVLSVRYCGAGLFVCRLSVGSLWLGIWGAGLCRGKTSGEDYVSLGLADPAFGSKKVYANLGRAAGQDDENVFAVIWNPTD